jgi:hypothetical protein
MFVLMAYLPTFVCPKCELLKVGIFAFWIGWKIVATLGKIEPSIPTKIYRNGGERFFFGTLEYPLSQEADEADDAEVEHLDWEHRKQRNLDSIYPF